MKACRRASAMITLLSLATSPVFAAVTYTKDVAPIFFEHCVACHRPGDVAPFSLMSFQEARPWAKSIAKAVNAKIMPPWSGESDRLHFKNDNALTDDEIATILAWIDEGTKRGNPDDMPTAPTFTEGWKLGEPDYTITLEEIAVPADGEDLFPLQTVTIDIEETKWVQAIEFMPSDPRVAHHMQTTYSSAPSSGQSVVGSESAANAGVLAIWTAGMQPYEFPVGTGRVLHPDTKVRVDSHYHPFGEATTDQMRIGLHWGEGDLEKEVATFTVANMGLRIPPGASAHEERAFHLFDADAQILAFSPHLHVRGKAMRYDLTYPDGRKETLLDVPQYNYNWQWLYYPTQPVNVPAGSRIDVTAVWDNSAANPANPDPTKEIIYRGDTFNEMFVGFFEAIPAEGVYHKAGSAAAKIATALAQHPADQTWMAGGFLPFGFYLPEQGEGWLYLSQGLVMFTLSLDDFDWDGQHLTIRTQFPTPEASATTTVITAERTADGSLKGTLNYGVDSQPNMKLPMLAKPMTNAGD